MTREHGHHLRVADMSAAIPTAEGKRFAIGLERGQLLVELYQPVGRDPQGPHTRDEAYVVIKGEGAFVLGPDRIRFSPGDFLFVPAGVVHRFEDFSEGLTVWVLFFGPEGGEQV